jgi:hypothetical protein
VRRLIRTVHFVLLLEVVMQISSKILNRAIEAMESDECLGFCLSCKAKHDEVEPDVEGYECQECGECQVYGAEQIVIMGGF